MNRIYVALDLETTGLRPERDVIIEIGAVKFRENEVLETWSSLVNPQRPIPHKITQLTGITQAEADQAPTLSSVISSLRSFVRDCPIVGHSVPFDLRFLKHHNLFLDNPAIDTFELASILLPHAARYSLGTLADALGITFPTRHRALDDALATKDLFLGLLQQASQLDLSVIREINRLAAKSNWSLRPIFQDLERDKVRFAFTGSIGQQLMAKGALDGEGSMGLLFTQEERAKPLQPKKREERQLLDVASLAAMLEEGGDFSQKFPGYEYRPQQVEMLRAVAEAFNGCQHLLVEAGTGTGKSIAYLLPAAHFAVQNGERVVISTNTINLQDQLFVKDIPDLKRILSFEFKAALLKGRSNYICLRRLAALRHAGNLSIDVLRVLAKVLVWLPSTVTGDQAELFMPTLRERLIWNRICSDSENCLAERCAFRQEGKCFFYRARQQAEGAHLIVVNHALLLSDVAVENRVLPEYRYLIVDEAHHLEDATTKQLSFEVNLQSAQKLLSELGQRPGLKRYAGYLAEVMARCRQGVPDTIQRELEGYIKDLYQEVEAARRSLHEFFDTLSFFLKEHSRPGGKYNQRIRLTSGLRVQPAWSDLEIAGDDFSVHLLKLGDGLRRLYSGLGDLEGYDIPDCEDLLQGLLGYHQQLEDLREQLNALIAEPSPNSIYWAEISAKNQEISLHAAPLHIGQLVERHLLTPKDCLILTSATLCTDGDFSFIKERLNAWEAQEVAVGSPFDYANSTLLYLVDDIPEPNQPYYQKAVQQALIALCQATRGRTLSLFTSYSQLRNTSKAITPPLAEHDIVVFQQGDGSSRRQLLENFRTTPRSVLLGTRSFWEGIDVMGKALSCLVIARLPFSVPTDPVFATRSETFEDPFGQYAVPETILRFRQGFGRLIRSKTDRGVVVVLDKRVLTRSYGQSFLNSLPECTVKRGPLAELPTAAARWIDGEASYRSDLGL
jgi:DNA polymerase-3 subunit epsilon/ATP-dependent DNA helicase DinG